jgi:hypothetical protein
MVNAEVNDEVGVDVNAEVNAEVGDGCRAHLPSSSFRFPFPLRPLLQYSTFSIQHY